MVGLLRSGRASRSGGARARSGRASRRRREDWWLGVPRGQDNNKKLLTLLTITILATDKVERSRPIDGEV